MFEKKWLRAVDKLGKLIDFVDFQSRHASETLGEKVWANTYLSTCLVDFIILERKQDTFNTVKHYSSRKSILLSPQEFIENNKD